MSCACSGERDTHICWTSAHHGVATGTAGGDGTADACVELTEAWARLRSNLSIATLAAIARTCRRFHRLAHHPSLWRNVDVSSAAAVGVDDAIALRLVRLSGENLKSVNFCNTNVSSRLIRGLVGRTPHLSSLELETNPKVEWEEGAVVSLLHAAPALERLTLRGFKRLPSLGAEQPSFPLGLRLLALHDCLGFEATSLADLLEKTRDLNHLTLSRMPALSDAHVRRLGESPCSTCPATGLGASQPATRRDMSPTRHSPSNPAAACPRLSHVDFRHHSGLSLQALHEFLTQSTEIVSVHVYPGSLLPETTKYLVNKTPRYAHRLECSRSDVSKTVVLQRVVWLKRKRLPVHTRNAWQIFRLTKLTLRQTGWYETLKECHDSAGGGAVLPELQELDVADHRMIAAPALMAGEVHQSQSLQWLQACCPRLAALTITSLPPRCLPEALGRWDTLRVLRIGVVDTIPSSRHGPFYQGAGIQRDFQLRHFRMGRSNGNALPDIIAALPLLEVFDVALSPSRPANVFEAILRALASRCRGLRVLRINCPCESESRAPGVNEALRDLRRCRLMEEICLFYDYLSDDTLDAWSSSWRRLRTLLIPGAAITDRSVAKLGARCRGLAVINLRHCLGVTGRPFQDGRFRHCTVLR